MKKIEYSKADKEHFAKIIDKIRTIPTIATLQVKMVGPKDTWWDKPSACVVPYEGSEYFLILNPKVDEALDKQIRGNMPSIMAHELGHFISGVLDLPDNGRVAEEHSAWELAEKMIPINQNVKHLALKGYNRNRYYWKAEESKQQVFSLMYQAGVDPMDYFKALKAKDETQLAIFKAKLEPIKPQLNALTKEAMLAKLKDLAVDVGIQPPDDM